MTPAEYEECLRMIFEYFTSATNSWQSIRRTSKYWRDIADRVLLPGYLTPQQAYCNAAAARKYGVIDYCEAAATVKTIGMKIASCPRRRQRYSPADRWQLDGRAMLAIIDWPNGTAILRKVLPIAITRRQTKGEFLSEPPWTSTGRDEIVADHFARKKYLIYGREKRIWRHSRAPKSYLIHRDWVNMLAKCAMNGRPTEFVEIYNYLPGYFCPQKTARYMLERLAEELCRINPERHTYITLISKCIKSPGSNGLPRGKKITTGEIKIATFAELIYFVIHALVAFSRTAAATILNANRHTAQKHREYMPALVCILSCSRQQDWPLALKNNVRMLINSKNADFCKKATGRIVDAMPDIRNY